MIVNFVSLYVYLISFILISISLYAMSVSENRMKKLLSLSIFQTAVIIFYINIAYLPGAKPPITNGVQIYANPLPHVLMLTAIVVGVATLSVGYALCIKIHAKEGKK